MRSIRVIGGSVQLLIEIKGTPFSVDVWSVGHDAWKWTAKRNDRYLGKGQRRRWSEARTAAFRACLKEAGR